MNGREERKEAKKEGEEEGGKEKRTEIRMEDKHSTSRQVLDIPLECSPKAQRVKRATRPKPKPAPPYPAPPRPVPCPQHQTTFCPLSGLSFPPTSPPLLVCMVSCSLLDCRSCKFLYTVIYKLSPILFPHCLPLPVWFDSVPFLLVRLLPCFPA